MECERGWLDVRNRSSRETVRKKSCAIPIRRFLEAELSDTRFWPACAHSVVADDNHENNTARFEELRIETRPNLRASDESDRLRFRTF